NGTGNDLDNVLIGNSGSNVLNGMGGADTMIGGAGNDSYYVDSTSDVVTENPDEGTDRVYAAADYTIGPNIEQLWLLEGAGSISGLGNNPDNYLSGNSGNNTLIGGDGRDQLAGAGGGDRMIGGAGDDSYYVDSTSDVVIESPGEGNDGVYASLDYTLGPNLEWLDLEGTGNINCVAIDLDDVLIGNPRNNTLIGGLGDDTLGDYLDSFHAMGMDTLIGGAGNDTYFVNIGDRVTENPGEGFDTVYALLDYTLGPNIEKLKLLNHWNANYGSGDNLDNALAGNYRDNVLDGKGGQDQITGGGGDETFWVVEGGGQEDKGPSFNPDKNFTVAHTTPSMHSRP